MPTSWIQRRVPHSRKPSWRCRPRWHACAARCLWRECVRWRSLHEVARAYMGFFIGPAGQATRCASVSARHLFLPTRARVLTVCLETKEACWRAHGGKAGTLLYVVTHGAPSVPPGANHRTQESAARRRATCRRSPFPSPAHLLTFASAYRTATAVDCWRLAACRVEQPLPSLPFYGVVERLSSATTVCAWCASTSSPWLCRRTLAWCSHRVCRGLRHYVHLCLGGTRREHLCVFLGVCDHRADPPRP